MAKVCMYLDEAEEGHLPSVCICCGEPDAEFEERRFVWYPWWMNNPLWRLFWEKRARVMLPFCEQHGGALNLWAKGPRGLWGLRPVNISNETITLNGVADEFVEALERYRDGEDTDTRSRPRERSRSDRRSNEGVRRLRRPSPRPAGGGSGVTVLLILLGVFIGMPVLICGGLMVMALVLPRSRPLQPDFGAPPPFAGPQQPDNQLPAGNLRPEDAVALLGVGQEGFPGTVPWSALAMLSRPDFPRPPSEAEVRKAIEELRSRSVFSVRDAADRLAKGMPVEKHRKEVAAALLAASRQSHGPGAEAALKALAVWGTSEEVPSLLATLEGEHNPWSRAAIMETLGAIKDPRAAEPLAKRLADFRDHDKAAEALKALGPAAEKAVLPYLKNNDRTARIKACEVLDAVGTAESLEPLETATKDRDRQVAESAQKALDAIKGRRDAKKPEKPEG